MSDNNLQHTSTGNGAAPTSTVRRRIANTSIVGSEAQIKFAAETVTIDAAKIHASIKDQVAAYGASAIAQIAYTNADDPVAGAKAIRDRLYRGEWRPGLPRREAEPDVLTAALAEHLGITTEAVDDWVGRYATKKGMAPGGARRALRAHPDIAVLTARITADRARKAAQAAKAAPHEKLTLD